MIDGGSLTCKRWRKVPNGFWKRIRGGKGEEEEAILGVRDQGRG